ncbi:alanine racemase domain-containing protein [Hyphomicrobium denitrificans 1NES1]|uniref:Pyridoxal phosphate homeostasis protein n=1 Tax=Hyphomicrobium denitrificans 1NES1 TaxID=670307 RepID=N0B7L6_9HYPH|nr:YggS family pyridoxal phosphate-dependent enzyme [Hyphomicrobium denitrificans]AGK59634.1 alanine racemase domain-containing protein [Hyphomicrobium denitrificans 1NES1]
MEGRANQGLSVKDDGYHKTAPERLKRVRDEIVTAAEAAKRSPADVELIAVSKTFDIDAVRPVLAAGQRVFGENRVQEAERKWPVLKSGFADIELHLIGPLQSNKAKDAVALFDVLHTIDREKIARAIANEISRQQRALRLFVQVNTGEEPQKAGVMPREAKAFVEFCQGELKLPIVGLMCIPPVDEEPAVHFAFLAKLAKEAGLQGLSMGMSSDFETAIAFGATHVRVGSAIFGER